MQVLVALSRTGGEAVTRDQLVASCWGGLAIGDDAINRCIGRLRRIAEEEAPGAFVIETLPRIGYRLRRGDSAATKVTPRWRSIPWRIGFVGILAAAVVAAGVWVSLAALDSRPAVGGIAVMPFETPPGDVPAREFAAGLADEVASTLSKSELVSVDANTAGPLPRIGPDALALRLGATYALSGHVNKVGESLAVTVTVDDARRHELLWSVVSQFEIRPR